MALVLKDRVKETTTTTGTGAISLGGAVANFQAFSAVLSNADTTYYAIVDTTNTAFEVGLGTYASSGNTLTRTTVLESSNSGSAVNLSAGSKTIFIAYPAEKAVYEESDGSVLIENLELNANFIKSTDTNGNIQLFPNGTGFTELYGNTNAGAVRFNCESNSHGVTLKGPPHSAGATYSLELPNADGSSGEFLQTNGSGKLSFGSAGGGLQSIQVFTSSGTWTKPSGISKVKVTVVGGGGGGYGVNTYNEGSPGGGGGGSAIKFINVSSVSSVSVTIGAGGAGGANATASDGGTTSFGSYTSATGGSGAEEGQNTGGVGGSGSSGDINLTGGTGRKGGFAYHPNNFYFGGAGGASLLGPGTSNISTAGAAINGIGYGSGGSGRVTNGTNAGGSGSSGIIIVEEYA